jgi:hypothetical protein
MTLLDQTLRQIESIGAPIMGIFVLVQVHFRAAVLASA